MDQLDEVRVEEVDFYDVVRNIKDAHELLLYVEQVIDRLKKLTEDEIDGIREAMLAPAERLYDLYKNIPEKTPKGLIQNGFDVKDGLKAIEDAEVDLLPEVFEELCQLLTNLTEETVKDNVDYAIPLIKQLKKWF